MLHLTKLDIIKRFDCGEQNKSLVRMLNFGSGNAQKLMVIASSLYGI